MLRITDQHLLEDSSSIGDDRITFMRAADYGGLITPELIVVHFTAGGLAERSADWLSRKDEHYVSAHIVIGRDGGLIQLVPFDRAAYHAGRSTWAGRAGCNSYSVGIELANYGPLERNGSKFFSWSGQEVPADKVFDDGTGLPVALRHKHGGPAKFWERFPDIQVGTCAKVVAALLERYNAIPPGVLGCEETFDATPGQVGILGHEDLTKRKVDPGPAWNWSRFDITLAAAIADRPS